MNKKRYLLLITLILAAYNTHAMDKLKKRTTSLPANIKEQMRKAKKSSKKRKRIQTMCIPQSCMTRFNGYPLIRKLEEKNKENRTKIKQNNEKIHARETQTKETPIETTKSIKPDKKKILQKRISKYCCINWACLVQLRRSKKKLPNTE